MEASRKAVEAYRCTLLIDRITTDDDNLPSAYRLDEISQLLKSSSVEIMPEMAEYTLKRLRNKSPRVKQKALRLIKYTVGKAGHEYKRELQRHSAAIRELFTFKGQVDPLRGDALNKAVRDAAHEAIAAIFAVHDRPLETLKRMEGFGNSNFQTITKGENSMMGFGSSSAVYTPPSNELINRSVQSQDTNDFEKMQVSLSTPELEETKHAKSSSCTENCSMLEDRLLDSITAPGGLRLQPTRESLQLFMVNARKLDLVKLAHALKTKIQSHSWQVRLKAVCVLEAILRQQNLSFFQTVVASFEADGEALHGCVQDCLQSPQTSLREKAKKVLDLIVALDKEGSFEGASVPFMNDISPSIKAATDVPLNLMETGSFDATELNVGRVMDDILGLSPTSTLDTNPIGEFLNAEAVNTDSMTDDPFTGMHIHVANDTVGALGNDILSSNLIADSNDTNGQIVGLQSKQYMGAGEGATTVHPTPLVSLESLACSSPTKDFMINRPSMTGSAESSSRVSKSSTIEASLQGRTFPVQCTGNVTDQQRLYLNHPFISPVGMAGSIYPNTMMPQLFPSETLQLNKMGNFLAQQQFFVELASLQSLGLGVTIRTAGVNGGEAESHRDADSDSFDFSSNPAVENHSSSQSMKEETHAFDFISDHLCAIWKLKKAS